MPASSIIVEATKDWLDSNGITWWMPFDVKENSCLNADKINDLLGYKHQDTTLMDVVKRQEKDYPEEAKRTLALDETQPWLLVDGIAIRITGTLLGRFLSMDIYLTV